MISGPIPSPFATVIAVIFYSLLIADLICYAGGGFKGAMLKELFTAQQKYINAFFDRLDLREVEALMEQLIASKGVIFFCGVGKSGMVAEKLAMTMVSTGVRSWYLPPTNALHGDLGIVSEGDTFIFLSKSGESDELLNLIPFIRNKGAKLIAWVSKKESRLEKACDTTFHLPLERELCPFDLAPTTSDVIQLIFGNVLAVALMRARDFSLDDYAENHPAGRIGKRITVRVRDLMLSGDAIPRCRPDAKLMDQLVELSDKRCGCLLVVDEEDQVQGIFTDGDLRRALQSRGSEVLEERLDALMTSTFKRVASEAMAIEALQVMEADQKHPVMVLPVVDKGKLRGLIKMHDIVQSGI
jgi:arabinose-5-phosphate isomerase